MNKNKYAFRMVICLLIVIVVVTFGLTYSYFTPVFSAIGSNLLNVNTSTFDINFTTSQYFNGTFFPIDDSVFETYAPHTDYNISLVNNKPIKYEVQLSVIPNSEYFSTIDVMYAFHFAIVDADTNTVLAIGPVGKCIKNCQTDFNGASDEYVLKTSGIVTQTDQSKNYKFYMWLGDDGGNQDVMTDFSFTAKVIIKAYKK